MMGEEEHPGRETLADIPATVADHVEPHRGDVTKFFTGPLR